jgi:hypothetical protein
MARSAEASKRAALMLCGGVGAGAHGRAAPGSDEDDRSRLDGPGCWIRRALQKSARLGTGARATVELSVARG